MLQFLGENYYVDFKSLEDEVNIPKSDEGKEITPKKETEDSTDDNFSQHISVFLTRIFKTKVTVVTWLSLFLSKSPWNLSENDLLVVVK